MNIYKHRGVIAFGFGFERVGIYHEDCDMSQHIVHFKIDFWHWHIHFNVPYTRKFRSP